MALNRVPQLSGGPPSRGPARDELVEAARALMKERDELDIPLADVARRAGVNVALVKYYFGNKHGLLRALLDNDLQRAVSQLDGLVAAVLPPPEKMRIHLAGLINLYFDRPYINRLILEMVKNASAEERVEITDLYIKPMFKAYDHLFEAGVKSGDFKPLDPMLFYFNIIGACDQIFSQRVVLTLVYEDLREITADLRRRYIRQTSEMIMAGLLIVKEPESSRFSPG